MEKLLENSEKPDDPPVNNYFTCFIFFLQEKYVNRLCPAGKKIFWSYFVLFITKHIHYCVYNE